MAIGPNQKEEIIKKDYVGIANYKVKKIAIAFFEKPLYYLFYSDLFLTIVGLFFNKEFSWKFYLILIVLSLCELYKNREYFK